MNHHIITSPENVGFGENKHTNREDLFESGEVSKSVARVLAEQARQHAEAERQQQFTADLAARGLIKQRHRADVPVNQTIPFTHEVPPAVHRAETPED